LRRLGATLVTLAAVGLLLAPLAKSTPAGAAAAFTYFPSASEKDGRMVFMSGAGGADEKQFKIAIPAVQSSFEIGIFDGDTGKDNTGARNEDGGNWDRNVGNANLQFDVFADPKGDGSGTTLVTSFSGAVMPNNDWFNITIPVAAASVSPNGNHFYNLRVRLVDPAGNPNTDGGVQAPFKLRTDGTITARTDQNIFSFQCFLGKFADKRIIYPDWNGNNDHPGVIGGPEDPSFFLHANTTYDGSWHFFLDMPNTRTNIVLWDEDFDYGSEATTGTPSGTPVAESHDDNDADTPPGVPAFASGLGFVPQGAQGVGTAPDDSRNDSLRRTPSVKYRLIDPNGKVYLNENPSGNNEWEQFKITTDPVGRSAADYSPNASRDGTTFVTTQALPAGVWDLNVFGLDIGNGGGFYLPGNLLGVDINNHPVPPLRTLAVGGVIFLDSNHDGIQQTGEPLVKGVVLNLLDSNGQAIAQTTSAVNGSYHFDVDPGTYTVQVAPLNFTTGQGLDHVQSTTGGTSQGASLTTVNQLNHNFGFAGADTTPPVLTVSCPITELWPPNHDLVNVNLSVSATDDVDPSPTITVQVFSNLGDTAGTDDGKNGSPANFSPDAKLTSTSLRLRAERSGGGGRIYLIVVTATDAAGNQSIHVCAITVPTDQSKASRADIQARADTAELSTETTGNVPSGFVPVGTGPTLGPKQ
jgi:hypothetical protein